MRVKDATLEILVIVLTFGAGVVASIPYGNPPLLGGLATVGGYVIIWTGMSVLRFDKMWAVHSDFKQDDENENIFDYQDE